ncbi:MAG: hypothetical protein ACJAYF_001266 [Arenicella sp.]|jgi:hypothetical protein
MRTASVFKVNIGINDAAEVRSAMRPAFGCSDSEFLTKRFVKELRAYLTGPSANMSL